MKAKENSDRVRLYRTKVWNTFTRIDREETKTVLNACNKQQKQLRNIPLPKKPHHIRQVANSIEFMKDQRAISIMCVVWLAVVRECSSIGYKLARQLALAMVLLLAEKCVQCAVSTQSHNY